MKREESSRAGVAADRITALLLLAFCLIAAALA
jgi:hypothetical protein